jgi:methyl-accepting chemotaxis protein
MNKLSIGLKLGIGILLLLIMFITVSVSSYQNIQEIRENEARVNHTNEVLLKIQHINADLMQAETGKRGYIITGDMSYLEPYDNAIRTVYGNINELTELTSENTNHQTRVTELKQKVDLKLDELKTVIDIRKNAGFETAQEFVSTNDGKKVMNEISQLLTSMEKEEVRLLKDRTKTSAESTENAENAIIWLTGAACVLVIFIITYFVKNIAIPITRLSDIAENISKGKITVMDRTIKRKDEIGVLMSSFKLMQQYLQEKTNQANSIAEGNFSIEIKPISDEDIMGVAFATMIKKFRKQLAEIAEAVQILSSSSSEFMATVSQLSSTTAETSTSISETTSTVEEVKQTAEVSNQRAVEVSESAQNLANISNDGYKSIQDTIEGMNKIKHQMESIAGIVIQLSEKSHTIGEIATTVNDLSEQSNLLAVNASIEAAKAGEQGKGFSVVAQEIKHLAERSKESTVQIRSILADIQKEISSAVMATEEGGKVIASALELSLNASEVITTLAANVEESAQANIQIAASSQQQLTGMDQITIAMESINEASRQVSNSTKQTEESVMQLNDLGRNLQMIMNQYRLK